MGDSIAGVDTTLTSEFNFDETCVHTEATPNLNASIPAVQATGYDPERIVFA